MSRYGRAWSSDSYPVLVGEVVGTVMDGSPAFPFQSWAAANRFKYPLEATEFLSHCGSAAEAFFIRPFTLRPEVEFRSPNIATAGDLTLALQVGCGRYRIDAVIEDGVTRLAMEVDGISFHHRSREQIAADYLRERRVVLRGYTVIRFTAQEVFVDASECWRQVDAILAKRRCI